MTKAIDRKKSASPDAGDYSGLVGSIRELLDAARRARRLFYGVCGGPAKHDACARISDRIAGRKDARH